MHKIFILSLTVLLFLSGCSGTSKEEVENIKNYESFIDAVANNKGIESKTIPFNYKMVVNKQKDKTYKYEIIIDNPQVAMYNIQAIAINPDTDPNNNIYPCIGVLGEDAQMQYNMIPYQSYGKKGFVNTIILDAISNKSQFSVNVMVSWKDSTLRTTSRVFFTCNYVQQKGDSKNGVKETADVGQSAAH